MEKVNKNELREMYYDKKMTLKEIGRVYDVSLSTVAKKMDHFKFKRRDRSEAMYLSKNQTECFDISSSDDEHLKIIGLMLYWCEGTNHSNRRKANTTLAFTNTNTRMLQTWLKFLRNICNVNTKKIKARLYLHKNQNGQKLKLYWARTLRIPLSNFENVSYTKKASTKPAYRGTVKIKVHNKKLFNIIKDMIAESIHAVLTKY